MATSRATPRRLPANPSQEHLRKLAKRLAKSEQLQLAAAQRRLAVEHGYPDWAALMHAADRAAPTPDTAVSPLAAAAARADAAAVRDLLAQGHSADGIRGQLNTPLWEVCDSAAPAARRLAVARLLLEAGASPRSVNRDNATALHAASCRGPLALVELLIRGGALTWQSDRRGKTALDDARNGSAPDRAAIVELLDRPVIRDRRFRDAVAAIHAGDVAALSRLLDRHPELLHARAVEPDCYPASYFRDPKLFWFIANNPTLMPRMPPTIVAVADAMIVRGIEQADLDYALELVMSNGQSGKQARQGELIATLLGAGATATPRAILMALAHRCLPPIKALLARGHPLTAPIAAAFGHDKELRALLAAAAPAARQDALAMAVINQHVEAARLCLDAGADPNAFLAVHSHSTPLHQAAVNDDGAMLELLVSRGANLAMRDTLWDSTPLGWAVFTKKRRAEAYLRRLTEEGAASS